MRNLLVTVLSAAAAVEAFPSALKKTPQVPGVDIPQTNCGIVPCLTFNAKDQLVDVSPGSGHEYITPGPGDIRGPCPGLNAAANHAYLSRNGVPTILDTITGLAQAFGMLPDLVGFLAAYAVAFNGDPVTETWSIGGVAPKGSILYPGSRTPQGISNSHNNYESDASVGRGDAYLHNGDAHELIMHKFEHMYNLGETYTLKELQAQYKHVQEISIHKNPYYFSGPFSGLLVSPAAHNFIINLMSNHSAEKTSGWLDRPTLKNFFAVTGEPGSFKWHPGQERIPERWYRRPVLEGYSIPKADSDVLAIYSRYPETFRLGGNTGKVNSFVGVTTDQLSGGAFHDADILKGNNLGCFAMQAANAGLPDLLDGIVGDLVPITKLMKKYADPVFQKLNCPQLSKYQPNIFKKYPGYTYKNKGARNS